MLCMPIEMKNVTVTLKQQRSEEHICIGLCENTGQKSLI